MTLPLLLKLIHVLAAFWFIAGLLGRWVCLTRAARATDVHIAKALNEAAGPFEKLMVIPGSFAVPLAGVLTAWAQGWPLLGFLQGAQANWLLVSWVLFLTNIPLINLVFLPRGRVFEKAMQDAVAQGRVTPELTAAFHDPVVTAAHTYELAVVAIIVILMVTKPF